MADEAGTNHGGGVLSRDAAYRKTAAHFDAALAVWIKSLSSRNEAIALGAANKIIDKCLPDLKAMEVTGQNGEPIKFIINTASGFIPPRGSALDTSETGYNAGSTTIQSIDLASESSENDNSDNRGNKTSMSS